MTRETIRRFIKYSKRLFSLKKQIDSFTKAGVMPMDPDDIPSDPVICDKELVLRIELTKLNEQLEHEAEHYNTVKKEIEDFINLIDDTQTREVFRLKLLYGYSWQTISDVMLIPKRSASARYFAWIKYHCL